MKIFNDFSLIWHNITCSEIGIARLCCANQPSSEGQFFLWSQILTTANRERPPQPQSRLWLLIFINDVDYKVPGTKLRPKS